MAYEYEANISNSISKNKDYFFTTTAKDMKDELQEVYNKARLLDDVVATTERRLSVQERKAKAWDNYIAEVRERVRFTENTEDDIESETQKVIDYYMEDE